jgi:hypothetical protein
MAGKPTLQQCKDVGITLGIPEDKSEHFFHHYNAQGWMYPTQLPITNLKSAMWRWQRKGYEFEQAKKEQDKIKLYPIKGKTCSERGCKMPAVYKDSTGDYDSYKCRDHLPDKVREQYK